MAEVVTASIAAGKRYSMRLPNGTEPVVSSYMGVSASEARTRGLQLEPGDSPIAWPVAYLVEQPPHSAIPGHFHRADQFQIFVRCGGTFGKRQITPCVHYAGAFTPYASITAGSEPLLYFTLRTGFDPGANWMPEQRDMLKAAGKPMHHGLGALQDCSGFAREPQAIEILPTEPDGAGAWQYYVPAGTSATGPTPGGGRGQFAVVMSGECRLNESPADEFAIAFVRPDEPPITIQAGRADVCVVVVQFGRK
jgi:hypothetical protein